MKSMTRSSTPNTLERAAAICILLLLTPLLILISLVIALTSRGPVLYLQERVGMGGRVFRIIKFRSMMQNAESTTGPIWARQDDPRVTRVGSFLRRLHLDELPQLINVIRGEMSFVGPRPERPHFVEVLGRSIVGYRQRLKVLPGITGLAQVNQEADSDLKDVKRKLAFDRLYIRRQNLRLDGLIVAKTLFRTGNRGMVGNSESRFHRHKERTTHLHKPITPSQGS